jgi:flavin reductase (DIM6/NTAB) family NADH-FMN oxidoreductase RutF
MTASWGGLGVLWNTPVATVYIRPQRYTYSLAENNDDLSLCFTDERFRKALGYCGTKSGRNEDKIKACGLATEEIDGIPVISDSRVIMLCKKLYADDLKEASFIDKEHLSHYDGDFHRFYILEIKKILVKE